MWKYLAHVFEDFINFFVEENGVQVTYMWWHHDCMNYSPELAKDEVQIKHKMSESQVIAALPGYREDRDCGKPKTRWGW